MIDEFSFQLLSVVSAYVKNDFTGGTTYRILEQGTTQRSSQEITNKLEKPFEMTIMSVSSLPKGSSKAPQHIA